jgi:hypothetical protein
MLSDDLMTPRVPHPARAQPPKPKDCQPNYHTEMPNPKLLNPTPYTPTLTP